MVGQTRHRGRAAGRASLRATIGAAALAVAVLAPAAHASHGNGVRWSAKCIQAAQAPVGAWYFDSATVNATAGNRCLYRSTVAGGYQAPTGNDWRVVIERPDGRRVVHHGRNGAPRCADDVIRPGDRVEIDSSTAISAGAGVGCG